MRDDGTANEQYKVPDTQSQPGKNPQVRPAKRVLLSGIAVNPSTPA
jgi:hypothetical protein